MNIKCKESECNTKVEYKTIGLCRYHYNRTPKQKAKFAENHAKYWIKNKEELSKYNKEYYDQNREEIRIRDRGYKIDPKNRFKACMGYSKRRNIEWKISIEKYFILCEMPCFYCDKITQNQGYGLDRLDNSRGYDEDNVVPCCGSCNVIRSDILSPSQLLYLMRCLQNIDEKSEKEIFENKIRSIKNASNV